MFMSLDLMENLGMQFKPVIPVIPGDERWRQENPPKFTSQQFIHTVEK